MPNKFESPNLESEKEPQIKFHFTFVEHDLAEKAMARADEIDRADIFGMEGVFTPKEKKTIQDISDGTGEVSMEKDFRHNGGEFREAELELLRGTQKPILFFDPSASNELWNGYDDYEMKREEIARLFEQGKFNEAMATTKQNVLLEGELEIKREKIMQQQILSQSKTLVKKYPKLKEALENNNDLNVTIVVGEAHTKIYRDMRKKNLPVTRKHSKNPVVYAYTEEGSRRVAEGMELSDELITRIMLEDAVGYRGGSIEDSAGWRKITAKLSIKDIKKISESIAGGKKIQELIDGIVWDPNADVEAQLQAYYDSVNKQES
jgi:hypothetical protein